VIDCNRPPHVAKLDPARQRSHTISGNEGISREAAEARRA